MKIILIILTIFLSGCKLNKVVNHHGIHNLEDKSKELFINKTNINQIRSLLGPPSSTSYFDDDILIYLERKTSNSKLLKLGKKKLIANNVLLLEPKNEEALYLIILKKIDDADYEVANSKYELFKKECASLCSKKNELNQLLNKSKSS